MTRYRRPPLQWLLGALWLLADLTRRRPSWGDLIALDRPEETGEPITPESGYRPCEGCGTRHNNPGPNLCSSCDLRDPRRYCRPLRSIRFHRVA